MIVDGKEIRIAGKFIKIAELKEDWDEDIDDPQAFIENLKNNGVKADVFTFMQRLPESRPKFSYPMEWDSVAAIPITTYENWYEKQLHRNPRNKIRKALKKGVVVKDCEFNDELIEGIQKIYNETPIRQNKYFPLYKMDFNKTRKAHVTFIDRAHFVGAFIEDEFVGFLKLVTTGNYMRTMGILTLTSYHDRSPIDLLIDKAVQICSENKVPFFVYGKFNYSNRGSESFKRFKHYLGFESIILPRYYCPLSMWGEIIVRLKLYREIADFMPKWLLDRLIRLRNYWHLRRYASK